MEIHPAELYVSWQSDVTGRCCFPQPDIRKSYRTCLSQSLKPFQQDQIKWLRLRVMALEGRRAKENKNSESVARRGAGRPSQWQKRVENWQIHLVVGADALSSILPMSTRCAAWDATTMTYFSQLTAYSLWTQTPQRPNPLTRGADTTHAQMCVHSSPWLISIWPDQITPANCLRHPVASLCVSILNGTDFDECYI